MVNDCGSRLIPLLDSLGAVSDRMAITVLPPTTIRFLNSAQVLTTPVLLVKELIDNAIDAKATSIDIIISPNTLDKVEVRDNGHGIQPDDLDALGRHGYTSKLRSFEELKFLGGDTLGFRGQALSSAVEFGEVTVTTKTEGELVATIVKLKVTGGVDHQTRASHPIGTTVCVENFMAKLPVRKIAFEKEATKSMAKINRLLQAYALARRSIKFNLKVSNNGKGSWTFIPHPSGDVRDTVLRVIGRGTAQQCFEATMPCDEAKQATDLIPEFGTKHAIKPKHFTMSAFLPCPQADPSKIGGGQFLSVDSRPVSHEKGTMKKIITIFKKYIRIALNDMEGKLKSPFIRLNIQCPEASYDANVEPAKDDVLFGNEYLVLETAEKLFRAVYGKCGAEPIPSASRSLAVVHELVERPLDSETCTSSGIIGQHSSLAASVNVQPRGVQSSPIHPIQLRSGEPEIPESVYTNEGPNENRTRWVFDMSEDFAEEAESHNNEHNRNKNNKASQASALHQIQQEQEMCLNPSSIAKKSLHFTAETRTSTSTNSTSKIKPTVLEFHRLRESEPATLKSNYKGQETMCSKPHHRLPTSNESDLFFLNNGQPLQLICETDFIAARSTVQDALISPPATQLSNYSSRVGTSKPFVSPFKSANNNVPSNGVRQTKLLPIHTISSAANNNVQQNISDNSDLAWAMDFEMRKEEATRRRRQDFRKLRAAKNEPTVLKKSRSSPHKYRYNAAVTSLEVDQLSFRSGAQDQANNSFQPPLPDDDPRVYFKGTQHSPGSQIETSADPQKSSHTKSKRLPLESIPGKDQLQQLIQSIPIELNTLQQITLILEKYNTSEDAFSGLSLARDDISEITRRLQAVVISWLHDSDGREIDIEYKFGNISS